MKKALLVLMLSALAACGRAGALAPTALPESQPTTKRQQAAIPVVLELREIYGQRADGVFEAIGLHGGSLRVGQRAILLTRYTGDHSVLTIRVSGVEVHYHANIP